MVRVSLHYLKIYTDCISHQAENILLDNKELSKMKDKDCAKEIDSFSTGK